MPNGYAALFHGPELEWLYRELHRFGPKGMDILEVQRNTGWTIAPKWAVAIARTTKGAGTQARQSAAGALQRCLYDVENRDYLCALLWCASRREVVDQILADFAHASPRTIRCTCGGVFTWAKAYRMHADNGCPQRENKNSGPKSGT